MKKPERLIGFLSYQDADYPFEFDENAFAVKLFPPSKDVWRQDANLKSIFGFMSQDSRKHEWIKEKRLYGTTDSNNGVVFCVQDSRSNSNGFISFDVNWYYCCSDELKFDNINGFRISGHDVNLFYPPQVVIESELQFENNGTQLKKISISSSAEKKELCGHYRIAKNIDAELQVTAYAKFHSNSYSNPIDSSSQMVTTFSKPVDLDVLIPAYYTLCLFFMFIEYRNNVDLGSIEVFRKNKDGKNYYSGILVFPDTKNRETHKAVSKRIITYNYFVKHTASLLTAIKNGQLGFGHLCDSIDDMRHYPPSRIIMILSEFEREYRNVYCQDTGRSEEYIAVKEDVINLVDSYLKRQHGKPRTYAKQLKKYIQDRDNSFEQNVKAALIDRVGVMEAFVKRRYTGSYEKAISGISSRMGLVRNGIAHSRLDLQLDAIHLCDIKIIEELIYAIRLKKMKVGDDDSQKAINALFAENFAL